MKTVLLIAAFAAGIASANAQEAVAQEGGSALPEACRAQAAEMPSPHGADTSQMMDHQRVGQEAMMRMDQDMMMGMMAEDPDMSFMCGMIAHHQGAIAMSEIELKHGDDEAAKAMAQRIIDAQKQEIAEITKWVEENAAK